MAGAIILDGKTVSATIRSTLKAQVSTLVHKPCLAVVLVGEDPASKVYVSNKEKACLEIGYVSKKIELPVTIKEQELLEVVDSLNSDDSVHGLLVQFPLPKHLSHLEEVIIQRINPRKDVDGFHPANVGIMTTCSGSVCDGALLPCTPLGVIRILLEHHIPIAGKHAVILGRSNLVGKPVALLLLARDATVTVCHSKTTNIKELARSADILVSAVGIAKFVTSDMVKPGAVVVDVGINRIEGGLVGDVDYESVVTVASAITPVPGGIGPMTIAMLMENLMKAYMMQVTVG